MLAQGAKIGRVAKHLADLDGQEVEQPRENLLVVEDSRLDIGNAVVAPLRARLQQPAFDRCTRIMPEIVMIVAIQGIQQQLDLDILDVFAGHLGIHTRTSDSSLSTSIGLAM